MATADRGNTGGDGFTAGGFVVADTDAQGARDTIALTSQVKFMRDGMEKATGSRPGLILVVVRDDERSAAVARITTALEADSRTPPRQRLSTKCDTAIDTDAEGEAR